MIVMRIKSTPEQDSLNAHQVNVALGVDATNLIECAFGLLFSISVERLYMHLLVHLYSDTLRCLATFQVGNATQYDAILNTIQKIMHVIA